jgi:hypothetical protein
MVVYEITALDDNLAWGGPTKELVAKPGMRYHSINRGKVSRVQIQMSPRFLRSSIMARKPDRILVIDTEATCWEGSSPPGQISEIIEIGLCVLDVPTLARVEQRATSCARSIRRSVPIARS